MITFKNILEEHNYESESRATIFSEFSNENLKLAFKKCLGILPLDINGRTEIWRGNKYLNKNSIYLIAPSHHERKSLDTAYNYYTLLIDNSNYWKEYPRRSQSLICSNSMGDAMSYGRIFRVVPRENACIGVCPESDILNGFHKGLDILSGIIDSIETFGIHISADLIFFNLFLYKLIDTPGNITDDFYELKNKLQNCKLSDRETRLMNEKGFDNLYDLIDYCLSPKLNGFKLMNYDNDFNLYGNHEIWTDSNALMFSY
jgi:hypothetical protein